MECRRLAIFLILSYSSKASELLTHERFRQTVLDRVSHAAEHEVFVGHLFGIEQPCRTLGQDLVNKIENFCSCNCVYDGEGAEVAE